MLCVGISEIGYSMGWWSRMNGPRNRRQSVSRRLSGVSIFKRFDANLTREATFNTLKSLNSGSVKWFRSDRERQRFQPADRATSCGKQSCCPLASFAPGGATTAGASSNAPIRPISDPALSSRIRLLQSAQSRPSHIEPFLSPKPKTAVLYTCVPAVEPISVRNCLQQ